MSSRSKFIQEIIENGEAKKELCETNFEKYLWNATHRTDKFENVNFDIVEEFNNIFNKYCRASGMSSTQIGEIIRGMAKLMYRWNNDGDDICCGPYSGIWYGLKTEIYCPFTFGDNSVEYWDSDFEALNMFSWIGKDYDNNIMLNTLIVETFDEFHCRNRLDIGDYYTNIVNFVMPKDIVKKFLDNDIDITNNFGCYGNSAFRFYDSTDYEINSLTEDIYITGSRKINFSFDRSIYGCGLVKFEIEFDYKDIDNIMKEYKDLFRYLVNHTTDKDRNLNKDKLVEDIAKMGFMLDEKDHIVKQEIPVAVNQ